MTYAINYNERFNSYEVRFEGKPSEAVRNALKALRFRWHSVNKCWYGYNTSEESLASAITGASTEEEPAAVVGDGYMGGGSVYGSKSNRYLHGSELSAAVRADLKASGIKGATCKIHTYAGGQNLTVTVKVSGADFVSLADYVDGYRIRGNMYWIEYGGGECIHIDKYFSLDADEQERIRVQAAEASYTRMTTTETDYRHNWTDFLTDAAKAKLEKVESIICAYRYDCSNSMVDYFDTNFYYDIKLRPVTE
jgi:hypothetical protein